MLLPHLPAFERIDLREARLESLAHSNNAIFLAQQGEAQFVLKWFTPQRQDAFQREKQMRECLARETAIDFPRLVESHSQDGHHYVLMEYVSGEPLLDRWLANEVVPDAELHRLGRLLAELHRVPLAAASTFVKPDTVLFSSAYKDKMKTLITPYLPDTDVAIDACHQRIIQANATLPHVLTHGDFGPHQIIVSGDRWVLIDFEFATLSPFADDLAATEARLIQQEFSTAPLLEGYFETHGRQDVYARVRRDFMAYNLLAMLTYAVKSGNSVNTQRLDSLRTLLD